MMLRGTIQRRVPRQTASGNVAATSTATSTTATSTPVSTDTVSPVITIVGNNPTTIAIHDSYIDLGATVTDNVDHNLGIHMYLDGVANDTFSLDTSVVGTHLIDYVAKDNVGNIATSTRTVNIASSTPLMP